MRQSTKRYLLCGALALLCLCGWSGRAQAQSPLVQTITELTNALKRVPPPWRHHRVSKKIFAVVRALKSGAIPTSRKQKMQDLTICMAALGDEPRPRRLQLNNPYLLSRYLYYQVLGYKRTLGSLVRKRKRLLGCLWAIHKKGQPLHYLRKLVNPKALHQERRLLDKVLPLLITHFERLQAVHLEQKNEHRIFGKHSRKWRRQRAEKRHEDARGHLLAIEGLLLRYKHIQHKRGLSRRTRLALMHKLWLRRPNRSRSLLPIGGGFPVAIHMALLSTSIALTSALALDQGSGGVTRQSTLTAWGALGGGLGVFAATPALAMIMSPKPTSANVMATIASVALVPALAISLTASGPTESQGLGIGMLATLPIHGAWLIIGWINQTRWRAKIREWKQPLPPSKTHHKAHISLGVTVGGVGL